MEFQGKNTDKICCPLNTEFHEECVTYRCAAWRWSEGEDGMDGKPQNKSNRFGYCGLAGKPFTEE